MSEMTECPTCGRDGFKTEHGMKVHHAHIHGNSIAGVVVECEWCGDEFRKNRSSAEEYDHHFCDNDCRRDYWSEQKNIIVDCDWCGDEVHKKRWAVEGADHHFCDNDCRGEWRSDRGTLTVECDGCGDEFQKWRSWVAKSDHDFCDRDCLNEWESDRGNMLVECDECGDEFQKRRSKVEESDHHFCNSDCWGRWWSESIRGEDHHRWAGGMPSYGSGWDKEKREQVREQQDRMCIGCGIHESEAGRRLDVHHIEKARSINDPEKRNAVENLVGLCQTCHKRWEKMSPLRPQTGWGESA